MFAMFKTIRFKLTFAFLLTVFSSIAATGLFSTVFFKSRHIGNLKDKLIEHNKMIEIALENVPPESYGKKIQKIAAALGGAEKIRITLIGDSGVVLADSEGNPERMDNHLNRPEIQDAMRRGAGSAWRMSATVGKKFLYTARKVKGKNGGYFFIRVAAPAEYVAATTRHMAITMFFAALAALILSFAVSRSIASHFTVPVERLRETSERIAAGDLSARSRLSGENEFGRLGSSMDAMAENIQKSSEDIKRKKSEVENILSSMRDGLIVIDRKKRIVLMNDAVCGIFDIKRKNREGEPLINAIGHLKINEEAGKVLETEAGSEFVARANPISKTIMETRIYPFTDQAGVITGAIIVVRDVTNIKKLEQVRTEFIENASHELRTPVTIIKGFVETLLGGAADDPKARKRFLELLDRESRRLITLIEDILALEKAETKTRGKEEPEIDVIKELSDCAGAFAPVVSGKGLELACDFPDARIRLKMDREDFHSVFNNLVDNAIKFTDAGKISLKTEADAEHVTITVGDTGEGMAPQHLDRIFERFYRVDKSRSREKGGTGLGLSIVRHLVEKQGGKISVESRPGGGSTFKVTFPT